MATYYSTKTYGNDRGLSCCFRQWRSTHSHCSTLHGYSIGIKLIFASDTLDSRNWVFDFGGLKEFKQWAEYTFDHTTVVAHDDPQRTAFETLASIVSIDADNPDSDIPHERGAIIDLRIVEGVGCELFAKMCYDKMSEILDKMKLGHAGRYPVNANVRLVSAEVFEHDANSAIYEG